MAQVNIWRLIAHHDHPDAALAWTKQNRRIALGWGFVGDLQNYASASQIASAIERAFQAGEHPSDNAAAGGINLWDFRETMRIGDLVILSNAATRELVVEVTGDYEFVDQSAPVIEGYQHQRPVRVTGWDADKMWKVAGAKPLAGHSPRWTLIRLSKPLDLDEV